MSNFSKTTKQYSDDIIKGYKDELISTYRLAEIYKVGQQTISRLLERNGIPRRQDGGRFKRKYAYDDAYFENIDTPDKAYFLGWMYSDGYNDESNGVIRLNLTEKDVEVLHNFKIYLKSDKPLYYCAHPKTTKNTKPHYTLDINSKQISGDLKRHGCMQAKSNIIKWPTHIKEDLIPYFIRGIFEGDGTVSGSYRKDDGRFMINVGIMGSRFLINGLNNYSIEKLDIKFSITDYYTASSVMNLGGWHKAIKFLDYLYYDNLNLILTRKYNKYLELKTWYNNKYGK